MLLMGCIQYDTGLIPGTTVCCTLLLLVILETESVEVKVLDGHVAADWIFFQLSPLNQL